MRRYRRPGTSYDGGRQVHLKGVTRNIDLIFDHMTFTWSCEGAKISRPRLHTKCSSGRRKMWLTLDPSHILCVTANLIVASISRNMRRVRQARCRLAGRPCLRVSGGKTEHPVPSGSSIRVGGLTQNLKAKVVSWTAPFSIHATTETQSLLVSSFLTLHPMSGDRL